jgi:hypothetical protein
MGINEWTDALATTNVHAIDAAVLTLTPTHVWEV